MLNFKPRRIEDRQETLRIEKENKKLLLNSQLLDLNIESFDYKYSVSAGFKVNTILTKTFSRTELVEILYDFINLETNEILFSEKAQLQTYLDLISIVGILKL